MLITTGETYYKVLNPSVKFDVANDFVPISMVASAPLILAVNSTCRSNSLADVVAYGKANPGKLSYGSAGIGSPHHMAGEMLSRAANINLLHVPYRGTALAITDLIANRYPWPVVTNCAQCFHRHGQGTAHHRSRQQADFRLPEPANRI